MDSTIQSIRRKASFLSASKSSGSLEKASSTPPWNLYAIMPMSNKMADITKTCASGDVTTRPTLFRNGAKGWNSSTGTKRCGRRQTA
eukprot:CAMPEP_0180525716 /NCGR_PEP_ID=MMETSP1036_2-20121128/59310_1 /TAXON_ID=632150 /ORGANISM="Azadinium spinosum, Strain 3D9" /LENGTH=86 /DNA_ID=CAMNT_0022539021 /DNA_START=195 /DNA_END=455 /DNA_ORIENTATION=+